MSQMADVGNFVFSHFSVYVSHSSMFMVWKLHMGCRCWTDCCQAMWATWQSSCDIWYLGNGENVASNVRYGIAHV